jgi:hypothetical protein
MKMVRKEDGNQDMKPFDAPEVLDESEKEDTADGNKHNFRGRLEMEENIGEGVVEEITELLKAKRVIVYGEDLPDNQYSEIRWSQYGLIEINEIAVMAKCGTKAFAAKAGSPLRMPPLADRIWGMDVLDRELSFKLADRIWEMFSDELIREAELLREKKKRTGDHS